MEDMGRKLGHIGLGSFVLYFEDYEKIYILKHDSKEDLFKKEKSRLKQRLLEENPEATSLTAQDTRIRYAIEIFESKWENEVLERAISSTHKKITEEIKQKAIRLLDRRKND